MVGDWYEKLSRYCVLRDAKKQTLWTACETDKAQV